MESECREPVVGFETVSFTQEGIQHCTIRLKTVMDLKGFFFLNTATIIGNGRPSTEKTIVDFCRIE